MRIAYRLFFLIGICFLTVFILWAAAPTDYLTAASTGELAAALSAACGVTSLFAGWKFRAEYDELIRRDLLEARAQAEAAVRDQVDALEAELAAARDYIARMEALRHVQD